jgi:hypothetical protein
MLEASMRKLLIAAFLVGIFVLIADTASARPRGMVSFRSSSKPAATHNRQRRDASADRDRKASASPPKSWVVAMPPRTYRPPRERSDADAYAVSSGEAASDAPFAAASEPVKATPDPVAKAPEPAAKAPEPQKPVRMVVLNPDPPRKQAPAGRRLPHNFAVCYWDQGGHCIGR